MNATLNAYKSISSRSFIRITAIIFAIFGVLMFLARAKAGLHLFEFGDEAEKFVAAQMMKNGMILYRDIFAHHGPILYIISHAYVNLVDPADFSHIRWFMVGLALLSSFSIYTSPIFKNTTNRLIATGLFLVLLSSIWVLQGIHMILYHQIGGFLFIIPVTQLFLPLLFGYRPRAAGLACTGFSSVAICFTAYAFGPSVLLIVLASFILMKIEPGYAKALKQTHPFFWGVFFATSIIIIWLLLNADLEGFFVYHFYFNQAVYSKFIEFNLNGLKNLFLINFAPQAIVHTFVLFLLIASAFLALTIKKTEAIKKNKKSVIFSVVLFFFSLIMLDPRGGTGFHGAGFAVVGLAIFSTLASHCIEKANENFRAKNSLLIILALCSAIFAFEKASNKAVSSPQEVKKSDFEIYSASHGLAEDYGLITELASHDRDLLTLIFNPTIYIKTGKLPASGNYYYLPWQAAYNRNPVDGYKIDICKDLALYRPSVIWFDNWKVWERYSLSDYEPCILEIMNSNYRQISNGSRIFIRSDRLVQDHAILGIDGEKTLTTPPLDESKPITLKILPSEKNSNSHLKRIGIKFKTHAHHNFGKAELMLSTRNGKIHRQGFSLSDLKDDQYRYFDVPSDENDGYASGEIRSISGIGISAWEIQSTDENILTCINYIYSNNKIAVTPGCPQ